MTICQNTIMKGLTSLQQISKVLYLHFVSCIQQIRLEKQKFLFCRQGGNWFDRFVIVIFFFWPFMIRQSSAYLLHPKSSPPFGPSVYILIAKKKKAGYKYYQGK